MGEVPPLYVAIRWLDVKIAHKRGPGPGRRKNPGSGLDPNQTVFILLRFAPQCKLCDCVHMKTMWIPERLPGLNELIGQLNTRGGRHAYNALKTSTEGMIGKVAQDQGFCPEGTFWGYLFVEPSRKRDPSNVSGGGVKLIEDALQRAQILPNDGWKNVRCVTVSFCVNRSSPGVMVANSTSDIRREDLGMAWASQRSFPLASV